MSGVAGVVRVAKVLAAYAVFAWLAWGSIPAIRRTFLLPELFGTLGKGGLILGGVVAAVVAWRYPRMGAWGEPGPGQGGGEG